MGFNWVVSLYRRSNTNGTLTTTLLCVAACFVQLLAGTTIGYAAFEAENINSNPNPFHVSPEEQSWVVSITHFGCIPGALVSVVLLGYMGRQPTMIISCLPYAVGYLVMASASNVNYLYAGRFITGFALGISGAVSIVYVSEIAPAKIRGTLSGLSSVESAIGQLYSYLLGAYVPWNWTAVANVGLSLLVAIGTCAIPETPRWLLSKSRDPKYKWSEDEAVRVLKRIRNNVNVDEELKEIEESLLTTTKAAPWRHLLKRKNMFSLGCCMFMNAMFAMGGNVVISQYCVTIFKAAGSSLSPDMQTILLGVMRLVSAILTTFTLDLIGRRFVIAISMWSQALFLVALGAYFYVDELVDPVFAEQHLSWLPLLCLMMFQLLLSWNDATIAIMSSELFSTDLRGRVSSIVYAWRHICMFLVAKYFGDIINAIGLYGGFWISAGCDLLGGLFYVVVVPETNRKTLERVQIEIHDDRNEF